MSRERSYLTIPSDDKEFRATVEKLGADADEIAGLRDRLAQVYPDARVSIGDSLGALPGEPLRVYIYRDGRGLEGD
jgi:hypothetical protein